MKPARRPARGQGLPGIPEQHHDVHEHPVAGALRSVPEWYIKNMKTYWEQNLLSGLPVLKSIAALPAFTEADQQGQVDQRLVPVAKTYAAQGTS